jgi:DNA topoisomerase VI subunit B
MPKYSVSLRLIASHRVPPNPNRNERTNDETMSGKGKRPGGPGKGKGDTFERKTFRTSRLADFASISELIKQTGQPPENWPLTIFKELADNAADEAEEAGIAPVIKVVVTDNSISVADRGRGMKPAVVKSLIDYAVTTSSRAAYVSPSRGQQGNALQSILPMGFALAPDHAEDAEVIIESQGKAHLIRFAVDPVRLTPVVTRREEPSAVKTGTRVTVRWPDSPRSTIAAAVSGFLPLAEAYGWFNPHLNLSLSRPDDDEPMSWVATDPEWTKWRPSQPTSPHWYDTTSLNRLMAAEIAHAIDRRIASPSVRDFIGQFRGLKGTQTAAAICEALGVAGRETLPDFFQRANAPLKLLTAMRTWSRPVKPKDLGVIGSDHLMERFEEDGCAPSSFVYRKAEIEHDGLPYVLETAFGYRGDEYAATIIEGFNFSPAVGGSPFNLEGRLENAEVEPVDPVTVFAHVACPRLNFLDRGKSRISLPDEVAAKLNEMVASVTAKWTKQKRAEIRDTQAALRRKDRLTKSDRPMKQTEASWREMPRAYMMASADNQYPANKRQIYYAIRDEVERLTGSKLDPRYFSQTLLPDYIKAHPRETADWDVVADDRGHFAEPHTGKRIGVGHAGGARVHRGDRRA